MRQCKKCGKSIPAQIAEGFAKRFYPAEFRRFLLMAIGSSDELVTHLRTIVIACPWLSGEASEIKDEYVVLSKRMNRLHQSWGLKFATH